MVFSILCNTKDDTLKKNIFCPYNESINFANVRQSVHTRYDSSSIYTFPIYFGTFLSTGLTGQMAN